MNNKPNKNKTSFIKQIIQKSQNFTPFIPLLVGIPLYIFLLFSPFSGNYTLLLYLIAYVILGGDVLLMAAKLSFKGNLFNENSLMALATIGAFCLGQYNEAVGVMLFYKTGESLQAYAVKKSKKNIRSLLLLQPNITQVLRDNSWFTLHPKRVILGETILVNKGEKIPLDGVIIKGETSLDTSSLTGESLPSFVGVESLVFSGTINLGESIQIKVLKVYKDSSIQKLIELINAASKKKSRTEQFISRFAKIYTPIVFFMALGIFIIPLLLGYDWRVWLEKSTIFLVVSCPCALVLSIPLGFFTGLGMASKQGLLIKSSEYLETLTKIKHIAMDKTGTITLGDLKLAEILLERIDKKTALYYIALTESFSSHPIALSLVKEYKKEYGELLIKGVETKETPGKGIKARIENQDILVGSLDFMQSHNVFFSSFPSPQIKGTFVYLSINQEPKAIAVVADSIKENTPLAIKKIKDLGISLSMLTGDNIEIATQIANKVGISSFFAQLLPQQKVEKIEALKLIGKTAFIGDGLNDAPSLAAADIGIAMGEKGADITIESADIVMIDDDLLKIPTAISIAKKTLFIVKQNIVLAISVKTLVMALTLFGLSNIWEGILSDVGVTLLTILNAIRIQK